MTNPSLASRCQRPAPPPKRIVWMDYARAFAILTVLLCHATEKAYSFQLDSILSTSLPSQTAAFCLFTVGRLGVPIFLFMSGYLMLDRDYSREKCLTFWRTKWLGLFLATEFWIAAYNIFLCLSTGRDFSVGLLIKNMLFLENVGMGHMWYMPMIIGLYLFLPFIANGLRKLDDPKLLLFPLACALVLFLGIPLLSILSQSFGHGALRCEIAEGLAEALMDAICCWDTALKSFPCATASNPFFLQPCSSCASSPPSHCRYSPTRKASSLPCGTPMGCCSPPAFSSSCFSPAVQHFGIQGSSQHSPTIPSRSIWFISPS